MALETGMQLRISAFPHIRSALSTRFAMWAVAAALLPTLLTSVYLFGARVLLVVGITCLGAVAAEKVCLFLRKQNPKEASSLVTGLLLGLSLPPTAPLWMGFLGGIVAICIGKQVYGGTGYNPFNPAIVGRVFLAVSFPAQMTAWVRPFDGVTTATPLGGAETDLWSLAAGTIGGSLGETSAIAIALGAAILLVLKLADWRLMVSPLLATAVVAVAVGENPLFHILAGGLLFVAVFMATDWVTTPVGRLGKWMFGLGLGVMNMVFRVWGSYPEGISFALLFMNALTPLINRLDLSLREGRRKSLVRAKVER